MWCWTRLPSTPPQVASRTMLEPSMGSRWRMWSTTANGSFMFSLAPLSGG